MYCYYGNERLEKLAPEFIFVYGSNLAGRHGSGAALTARTKFGAEYGYGIAFTGGQSYGIPTKDENIKTISLTAIECFVKKFKQDAKNNPNLNFVVTKIGCGLAGYKDAHIAPMFRGSPENCWFHKDWEEYLE
jgi:hypothetical protein